MTTMIFASTNRGKAREIRAIAGELGIEVLLPPDLAGRGGGLGIVPSSGSPPDVEETGATYYANAALKADAIYSWCGLPSLGDDTGLEVDALGGAPGLYSARYAGPEADARKNVEKLLAAMAGAGSRTARFRCVLVCRWDEHTIFTAEGVVEGEISPAPRGSAGFGYDPVFVVEGTGKTLAELKETSTVDTHRARACRALFSKLPRR